MLDLNYVSLFDEFALMLAVSVSVGLLAIRLKQPLIVAFIAVGILLGPAVLGWVEKSYSMELLAEFGIALLLFVVGLRLDLHLIKTMGPVSLATGLGQISFTTFFVFLICMSLGMSVTTAIYIAAAMSFSSTIIIVKLLSDKREIDSLHGRIAIGFLIVQDIMVVIAMIVITAFGAVGVNTHLGYEVIGVFAKGVFLIALVGVLIKYVLPRVLFHIAASTELLVLFSIAFAVGFAAFSDLIGFSKEVGAFLGGIALASSNYREAIGSRLTSVRDFLLLFFFISLGAQLNISELGSQLPTALLLSIFVLVGNPLIVLTIMGIMGFRRRTGFLSGLAVAQISEFSLILAALGLSLGHIDVETAGLITLVALITIATSTYMIIYSHRLFERLSPLLKAFERSNPFQEERLEISNHEQLPDTIVYGLGRFGKNLALDLSSQGRKVLGIDFDPMVIKKWTSTEVPVYYGDAEDPGFLLSIPLQQVDWVVSTITDKHINKVLINALRSEGYQGKIAITLHKKVPKAELGLQEGDVIFLPYQQAAQRTAHFISNQDKYDW